VSLVEHPFDIDELEKDHQLDDEQRIVGGAYVADVKVHLVGDHSQLLEFQRSRNFPIRILGICPVPTKLVQPLIGLGDVLRWTFENSAGHSATLLQLVHNECFMSVDGNRFFRRNRLMLDRIEPQIHRSLQVFHAAIQETHG
jgi:hypothetical protein